MATQKEAEVTESSSSSDPSITIGLAVCSSKSSKYAVKWALKNFGARKRTRFSLFMSGKRLHLSQPQVMGNYVPIDQVRDDIASAYEKEVECEAQNMLLVYKNMCDGKVVKGGDVAETISGVVSACQINKLVVGVSSEGNFVRKSKGTRTSSRICKSVPSFCTVYAVSKGGLSMVYSPGSEGDNSSEIFHVNESSNSELHSDDKTPVSAKPPVGLADIVETALEDNRLVDILDQGAGKWPVQEAHELAQLGLSCLEMRSKDRPDLKCKVLVELERLNNIASTACVPVLPGPTAPPSHFICPILKRVMQDPCIASDGYSYDRVAIEMWLHENEVSPLTNSRLPNKNLVPNHALLCAINSWKAGVMGLTD